MGKNGPTLATPVFYLQSIDFDPNIQLVPGLNIDSKTLSIDIKVVGSMEVSSNGKGVTGKIGFVSSGYLPPPLRLLPDSALKSATSLINMTVKNFAVKSFQRGAKLEYQKFIKEME